MTALNLLNVMKCIQTQVINTKDQQTAVSLSVFIALFH